MWKLLLTLTIASNLIFVSAKVQRPSHCACEKSEGVNPSSGQWCWQVALQNEAGSVFCSAVLIDASYAIAPGQCIFGRQASTTFLRVDVDDLSTSSAESQPIEVEELFVHQGYLNTDTRNDFNIGIIRLRTPVDCSKKGICAACLPERNTLNATSACVATSWNVRALSVNGSKTTSRPIRQRSASVMDQIDCETKLKADTYIGADYRLSDAKFCLQEAENSSKCMGDLGDPLVCNHNDRNEITGLNILGFSCFRSSLPSFYVRVSAFVEWINSVIENQPPATPAMHSDTTTAAEPSSLVRIVPVPPISFTLQKENDSLRDSNSDNDMDFRKKSPDAEARQLIAPPLASQNQSKHNETRTGIFSLTIAHVPAKPSQNSSADEEISPATNASANGNITHNWNAPEIPVVSVPPPIVKLVAVNGTTAVNQSTNATHPANSNANAVVNATSLAQLNVSHGAANGGVSSQRIAADGSLEQITADGSVQRQQSLQKGPALLTQVSPNVFQANIGGHPFNLDLNTAGTGAVMFPGADLTLDNIPAFHRQKRDNIFSSASLSSGTYTVPVITISANDASYDPQTGKFVFALPNRTTAFSSVSYLPNSAEEIKNQIIAQQDKILAQVDNYKKDILVALNANYPGTMGALNPGPLTGGVSSSDSGVQSVSRSKSSTSDRAKVVSQASGASYSDSSTKPPWASIYGKKSKDKARPAVVADTSDDEDDDVSPPDVSLPKPARPSNRPSGVLAQGSASAGGAANGDSKPGNRLGLGASVNSDTPSQGSLATSFQGANSANQAALSFKGDKISGETKHTANSVSSSVISSSSSHR